MKHLFRSLFQMYMADRQRKADALVLEHLDPRTLKDIGLESWQSPTGRRAVARQTQDALAWRAVLGARAGGFQ
jgi:uncharacterized protein YjiS (DUF1127 family)